MPRIARVVIVGYPHHVTQRGNYKQDIFTCDNDRKQYLTFVKYECEKYKLIVLAYCLMTNHIHFIAIPQNEDSMANVFKYAHMKYSQYYNNMYRSAGGHLFHGRYFSSILDEKYLLVCARYIERNPVRANIIDDPLQWEWSSAKVHCGKDNKDYLKVKHLFEHIDINENGWEEYITEIDTADDIEKIRKHSLRGRPLGKDDFIKKIESIAGRSLSFKPKGRPRLESNSFNNKS